MKFTKDELRPLTILKGLPDEHLEWLCLHGERVCIDTGDRMFERGQVADGLWIVVSGAIQAGYTPGWVYTNPILQTHL